MTDQDHHAGWSALFETAYPVQHVLPERLCQLLQRLAGQTDSPTESPGDPTDAEPASSGKARLI